jgi:hypothetical protein
MNARYLNLALAVIFLIVGILSTANTIRFNRYVSETLPRDHAQEQCNTETIETLKTWIKSRIDRDAAMDARDIAAQSVLDTLSTGQTPTPEQFANWREAVVKDREVRASAAEHLGPMPDCG